MKSATTNDIIDEVNKSISVYRCSGQRYRQLRSLLSKRDPELVGDALLSCWAMLGRPDADYEAQRFVASLLFALRPMISLTLVQILPSLSSWNLSVDEFPWYLAQRFGKEQVLRELNALESERPDDEAFSRAAAAVRYWLQADYVAAQSRY